MPTLTTTNPAGNYREWGNTRRPDGSGENPTVVVLHGWGVDSSQYEVLGLMLATRGFQVIVPDLPGWGKTPAPDTAWSVSEYMEWVREFINNFGLKRCVLFGHSFGGRIAIKYAAKYPNELRALVLCAAAGIKPPFTLKRVGLYCVAKIGRMIFKPPGFSFTGEILKKILYRVAGVTDYLKANAMMKKVLQKAVAEDLTPMLHSMRVPTLLLWGTADRATPYKDGQTMARLIPGAKFITFDGERHNLPKHIPEKVVIAIKMFLDNTNIL